jgi:hypothetical protein
LIKTFTSTIQESGSDCRGLIHTGADLGSTGTGCVWWYQRARISVQNRRRICSSERHNSSAERGLVLLSSDASSPLLTPVISMEPLRRPSTPGRGPPSTSYGGRGTSLPHWRPGALLSSAAAPRTWGGVAGWE